MKTTDRRMMLRGVVATAVTAVALSAGTALAQDKVRIGYAVSMSGPNAGGASITTIPNYELWVHEVNEAGGLELPDGSRRMIEVVTYDDRSSAEEVVRAVERLATQDRVDFILPPWGTGFNTAVAPLLARFDYPQLAFTSVTDRATEFAQRWPNTFWMLGGATDYAENLVGLLSEQLAAGEINNRIAMISVADGFGIELATAARPAFAAAGFELVYDVTYPVPTSDFSPMLNEATGRDADTFVAFSYPPHTFALMQQMQVLNFNVPALYLGVGSAFPGFLANNGADTVEGIMGLGGIDVNNERIIEYRRRHEEVTGRAPDFWGSVIGYASLEMLQEAVRRVGLDRKAVVAELRSGTFDTVLGEIQMSDNVLRDLFFTGQWQDGQFVGVAPVNRAGAVPARLPKAPWPGGN